MQLVVFVVNKAITLVELVHVSLVKLVLHLSIRPLFVTVPKPVIRVFVTVVLLPLVVLLQHVPRLVSVVFDVSLGIL